MDNKNLLNTIKQNLVLQFEIEGNPNCKLIKAIYDLAFI